MRLLSVGLATLLIAGGSAANHRVSAPDILLVNAKIFTSDSVHPWAEAVAIRGDRIVAVGTTTTIRALARSGSRTIDIGGRVVVPGFNDAHDHVSGGSPGTAVTDSSATRDARSTVSWTRSGLPRAVLRRERGSAPTFGRRL